MTSSAQTGVRNLPLQTKKQRKRKRVSLPLSFQKPKAERGWPLHVPDLNTPRHALAFRPGEILVAALETAPCRAAGADKVLDVDDDLAGERVRADAVGRGGVHEVGDVLKCVGGRRRPCEDS